MVNLRASQPERSPMDGCPDYLIGSRDDHWDCDPANHGVGSPAECLPNNSEGSPGRNSANCSADCPDNHLERNWWSTEDDSLPCYSPGAPVNSLPGIPDGRPANFPPAHRNDQAPIPTQAPMHE